MCSVDDLESNVYFSMQLEVSQGLELNIMAESIDQNIRNKMSKNMCLGTYYDNIQLLIKITSLHANVKISSLLNYPVILVPEFTSGKYSLFVTRSRFS